ncbi:MAG: HindIII family type II restriction endonuclease [Rhodopseudomonas sp.]|uniref:HindIII family type II restriction endonuclease n=1 Tax=Rhodopseudomonas sp. TaxID=1078 RepID=UPI0039E36C1C
MANSPKYILPSSVARRRYWIGEIAKISGRFADDADRLETEIANEIKRDGVAALLDHFRTCGILPEQYDHNSSKEKLYSKYTDIVLAQAFEHIGLDSRVIKERSDAADVDVVAPTFSFVADAKAFRLSRTAKNQKDFKINAMHSWKRERRYAMVVCPLHQLPSRTSQIYEQATQNDVLIFSYSHLAVLLRAAQHLGAEKAVALLLAAFELVSTIAQTKSAVAYWSAVNRTFQTYDVAIADIYQEERAALVESVAIAKQEGLSFLAAERTRITKLSHQEAITQLIAEHGIDSRSGKIQAARHNALFEAK